MNQNLKNLLSQLNKTAELIEFNQVMEVIDENYRYTPTFFSNGTGESVAINEAGTNEGSCKIFAFAKLHSLSEGQTLQCFGGYYRDDVLKHPDAQDHGNIRNFMKTGWAGLKFSTLPLEPI